MKRILLPILFFCSFLCSKAQVVETVGNPATTTSVNSYTGWANTPAMLTFSGSAEVQNVLPSTNVYASGGGNIYFNSTPGITFEATWPVAPGICGGVPMVLFLMYNFDTITNANDLVLEYSYDNGTIYRPISYHRLGGSQFASGQWNVMEGVSLITLPCNAPSYKVRFRQGSSSRSFRIDDISYDFGVLLPLQVIQFSGSSNLNTNNISWTLNTQDANSQIVLERSRDGRNFMPLNTQLAKGGGVFKYNYTDVNVVPGKCYYRLQMKHINGRSEYLQILVINTAGSKQLVEKIYPLPAANSTTLLVNSAGTGKAMVEVVDAAGVRLKTQTFETANGTNALSLDLHAFAAGMYTLRVSSGAQVQTVALSVIK
jgi:hypothetical protein